MDMMAMAILFDLASKNRRWDEHFEPRPPSRAKLVAKRLLSKLAGKQPPAETEEGREDYR